MVSAGFSHEKLNDTPDFSMDGTVSIILPCYNVAPYLDECLESLVRQTWEDLEIICVNDGSTDDTPDVLRGWAEKDARIRVIHQENEGAFSARNAGLDAAAGEYIGFVDPDDYVDYLHVCPAGGNRAAAWCGGGGLRIYLLFRRRRHGDGRRRARAGTRI